eukprot:GHVU01107493.1.p2 GENE.GHVU01107493.1~~GHVU01107493.1.p2  ORF type:complete len:113 (+),score=4.24 GHVU01107493.1:72-410(+)
MQQHWGTVVVWVVLAPRRVGVADPQWVQPLVRVGGQHLRAGYQCECTCLCEQAHVCTCLRVPIHVCVGACVCVCVCVHACVCVNAALVSCPHTADMQPHICKRVGALRPCVC